MLIVDTVVVNWTLSDKTDQLLCHFKNDLCVYVDMRVCVSSMEGKKAFLLIPLSELCSNRKKCNFTLNFVHFSIFDIL